MTGVQTCALPISAAKELQAEASQIQEEIEKQLKQARTDASEMIKSRSIARGITQDEYMSGNLLNLEVKPSDVSNAFVSLSMMKKTTGALITVDGGNVAAMVR